MSERLFDVVKSGFMVKRAQNKKRFTPVNYKQRWFELTKKTLSYFDIENIEVSTVLQKMYKLNTFTFDTFQLISLRLFMVIMSLIIYNNNN